MEESSSAEPTRASVDHSGVTWHGEASSFLAGATGLLMTVVGLLTDDTAITAAGLVWGMVGSVAIYALSRALGGASTSRSAADIDRRSPRRLRIE